MRRGVFTNLPPPLSLRVRGSPGWEDWGKSATVKRPSRSVAYVLTAADGDSYTRAVPPTPRERIPWEEAARSAAAERARVEARELWGRDGREVAPFNYRWEHVRSVVRIADGLAKRLGADREVVRAAAWLHDLAKERIAEAVDEMDDHGVRGAELAREKLGTTDFPTDKIDAVCDAIEKHVGLIREQAVEPLEAAILWDADKLSKIGLEATVQFIATRPALEPGFTVRDFWDWGSEWLELASKMAASMNTEPAREMAEERYRAQVALYDSLAQEVGIQDG